MPDLGAWAGDTGVMRPVVDAAGVITTIGGKIPFSGAASKEALKRFQEILIEDRASPGIGKPLASRKFYDRINTDRAARMAKLYPVVIKASKIDGVPVAIVSAADAGNDDERVLINLHGGAFLWGAGSGGLVEAIPVASVSKIKVITVDYREGPENQFPAANEDVEKVYRAILAHHKPERIGIYGCSAGGALTAESIIWFQDKHLPMPAAIGIFCAGIWDGAGDSLSTGPMLMGQLLPSSRKSGDPPKENPYFTGQAAKDFMMRVRTPGVLEAMIAKFPPTLLISGTRDMELSGTLVTNEMLTSAGVNSELHVWEGMWHSFFSDPELPESKAAYAVIAHFFERHLGTAPSDDGKMP
jgi:monoterpene epsilon-lactone hydrolase